MSIFKCNKNHFLKAVKTKLKKIKVKKMLIRLLIAVNKNKI